MVEIATPVFFIFLMDYYGISGYLGWVSLYTAILILVTVTDLEHRLIFNVVILPSILLALVGMFATGTPPWPAALVGGAAAFVLVYVAALLSRGGLGEGDVTLSTFLGLIIGFPFILLGLGFGVFFGGLCGGASVDQPPGRVKNFYSLWAFFDYHRLDHADLGR